MGGCQAASGGLEGPGEVLSWRAASIKASVDIILTAIAHHYHDGHCDHYVFSDTPRSIWLLVSFSGLQGPCLEARAKVTGEVLLIPKQP